MARRKLTHLEKISLNFVVRVAFVCVILSEDVFVLSSYLVLLSANIVFRAKGMVDSMLINHSSFLLLVFNIRY